ncbi:2Fe-2S iron-sulfur cluster-binding protein [Kutzneria sp. 744]|uniref:PDR/VanB family oxidoreductase n=1 Tax=Kutzneria sp. (strain 744) TaxID=345341 RepID=UPI0003EEDF15|nr:2Fe-2S iron-sulfur cluster-binding protein [Kutzneria sp. 744]EWM12448.1 phthalate 4,5-dioxygenase [Kutzneria sp. 744]
MPDRFIQGLARFTDVYTRALPLWGRSRQRTVPLERPLDLVVSERKQVADDVVGLRLAGDDLPAWQPGAHLDLHLPSGLRRQYSLCGDPGDRTYRIAARLIGPGSAEVHELKPGTRVTVRGPRNAFPFVAQGKALFVAGGIGITPILPMVRMAARLGMDWRLVCKGRSLPFLDELPSGDVTINPGRDELLADAPEGGAVYVCGPSGMLDAVKRGFRDCPATGLHYERFGPPPIIDGHPFEVQLGVDGPVLDVPADRSALAVLRDFRPSVPYSCQQGFCGTCRQRTVDGSDILVCVERTDGERLVLEER